MYVSGRGGAVTLIHVTCVCMGGGGGYGSSCVNTCSLWGRYGRGCINPCSLWEGCCKGSIDTCSFRGDTVGDAWSGRFGRGCMWPVGEV